MSYLPRLALRPCQPNKLDFPECFVIDGERVMSFGGITPAHIWDGLLKRRYIHPDHRRLSCYLDFLTRATPGDAFMILDNLGDGDFFVDRAEFVLNDEPDPEVQQTENGCFRIAKDWKDRYLPLMRRLVDCGKKVLAEFPQGCLEGEGVELLHEPTSEEIFDLTRSYVTAEEVEDILFALKVEARFNLGLCTWFTSTQSWWAKALSGEDRIFIESLNLQERPKRGCMINPLSDWAFTNIPLLLKHNVPFAIVWSEAVNATPRFARLNPSFLQAYYLHRREQGLVPDSAPPPSITTSNPDVHRYDHLLQDRSRRTKNSPIRAYDPTKIYLAQFHEGWRGRRMTDPEAITRSLQRYESYEKKASDGRELVIIEAWSIRGAAAGTVEETYELGFVATQSSTAARLGERVDLTVDERREMYKMKYAPWGGGYYEPEATIQTDVVPTGQNNALALLERLFYPAERRLDVSAPPPPIHECVGLESPPPGLLARIGDVADEEEMEIEQAHVHRPPTSSGLAQRIGGYVDPDYRAPTPPPTTHSSWRSVTSRGPPSSARSSGRRSASPRRGMKLPDAGGIATPDPSHIRKSDIAVPGSPTWDQRYRLLQASFATLLSSLSPYPYPRADEDLFNVAWVQGFVEHGFLFVDDPRDRLRIIIWLETQAVRGAEDLLVMCLVAGIRFYAGYRTDAPLPSHVKEIVGPRPQYHEPDYLSYGDGGRELYEEYKKMVQDLCRREHSPSFLFYGGMVSAIAAHYGRGLIEDKLSAGVGLTARYHKLGRIEHPYEEDVEVLVQEPSPKEINKLTGLVVGRDGQMLFSLFPPPTVWEEWWPGSGEWNEEEEEYFQDIVSGLERGTRTAMTEAKWVHQLKGLRHSILAAHPERDTKALSLTSARRWARLYDWAYGVEDNAFPLKDLGPGFGPQKLPLFR